MTCAVLPLISTRSNRRRWPTTCHLLPLGRRCGMTPKNGGPKFRLERSRDGDKSPLPDSPWASRPGESPNPQLVAGNDSSTIVSANVLRHFFNALSLWRIVSPLSVDKKILPRIARMITKTARKLVTISDTCAARSAGEFVAKKPEHAHQHSRGDYPLASGIVFCKDIQV